MCLRKCFVEGECTKVLPGTCRVSDDGKRLYHLAPGAVEERSFFKGDSTWRKDRWGRYIITEYHKIEQVILAYLGLARSQKMGASKLWELLFACRDQLKNSHLYSTLIKERLKALLRRGWVRETKNGFNITNAGLATFMSL